MSRLSDDFCGGASWRGNYGAYTGYRANLLQNARYQASLTGARVTLRGERVHFRAADGRTCVVWFPPEGRVNDLDITDMKDAILTITGAPAFTLK